METQGKPTGVGFDEKLTEIIKEGAEKNQEVTNSTDELVKELNNKIEDIFPISQEKTEKSP